MDSIGTGRPGRLPGTVVLLVLSLGILIVTPSTTRISLLCMPNRLSSGG